MKALLSSFLARVLLLLFLVRGTTTTKKGSEKVCFQIWSRARVNLQRKERQRQLQACELPVWDSSGASTVGRGTSALSPLSPALPRGAQAVLLSIAGAAWGSQGATLPWRQQDGVTPRNGAQPSQPLPALTAEHPSCHRCPKFLSSHEPPPAAILALCSECLMP